MIGSHEQRAQQRRSAVLMRLHWLGQGFAMAGFLAGTGRAPMAASKADLDAARAAYWEWCAASLVHGPAHQVVPHPYDPREPGRNAGLVPARVRDLDDLADVDRDAASRDDELVPGVDQDRG